jgi:FMN reductase
MTKRAVLVAGSPAEHSRSGRVLAAFGVQLEARGFSIESYSVRSFELEDLVYGRPESETVQRFLRSVQEADAVIFSTPVYKATYAGALKLIIDLIAPAALAKKALLAITTARLEPHLSQVDASFQLLFRFFRESIGLSSLGLSDEQLGTGEAASLFLDSPARFAFEQALERLTGALS